MFHLNDPPQTAQVNEYIKVDLGARHTNTAVAGGNF